MLLVTLYRIPDIPETLPEQTTSIPIMLGDKSAGDASNCVHAFQEFE